MLPIHLLTTVIQVKDSDGMLSNKRAPRSLTSLLAHARRLKSCSWPSSSKVTVLDETFRLQGST